jgi:hypothetical protein
MIQSNKFANLSRNFPINNYGYYFLHDNITMSGMSDSESDKHLTNTMTVILLVMCVVLFMCWRNRTGGMRDRMGRQGMDNPNTGLQWGKELPWRKDLTEGMDNPNTGLMWKEGMDNPNTGLSWNNSRTEGYILEPINSYESKRVNRGLNDLEMSANMTGRSKNCRAEKCVASKWGAQVPIQLDANLSRQEGMEDGDESQYTRDRNNMGSDIDSTLNELKTQDPKRRLTANDACPSVSGMNLTWTDRMTDDLNPLYGGYGAYAPTWAKINM